MAYPTGSGSEILSRTAIENATNAWSSFRWDGTMGTAGTASYTVPALHIITALNIVFCELGDNASQSISLIHTNQTHDSYILNVQPLPALGSYVYSEKIVLIGGDILKVLTSQAAVIDVTCNFIDQNWID